MVDSTRIGTSEPKYRYGASEVGKIYLGSSLVYSSRIEQTIELSGFNTQSASNDRTIKQWLRNSNRTRIIDALAGSVTRYLQTVSVATDGSVHIAFSGRANANMMSEGGSQDLLPAFETSGGFIITAGSNSITVRLDGADTSEPYNWTPSNSADVIAFYNAIGTSNVAANLTLFIE